MNDRHPHILNASTNLLGICFVIITGLKLTGANDLSFSDLVAWAASLMFLGSIVLSYMALRKPGREPWCEKWAERTFMAGVAGLTISVFVVAAVVEVPNLYDLAKRGAGGQTVSVSPTTQP